MQVTWLLFDPGFVMLSITTETTSQDISVEQQRGAELDSGQHLGSGVCVCYFPWPPLTQECTFTKQVIL